MKFTIILMLILGLANAKEIKVETFLVQSYDDNNSQVMSINEQKLINKNLLIKNEDVEHLFSEDEYIGDIEGIAPCSMIDTDLNKNNFSLNCKNKIVTIWKG